MDWLSVSILHSTKRFRFSSPALLVWLLLFGWAHAKDQFPYVAYISQDDTYIRSGPGRQYYPTEQVPQGYAVEVYRHDQSGWCAIRPTEQSFSWVSAHQVRFINDQVVEVTANQAVARVGSNLSPVRSAVQVMLPKGEQARVISGGPYNPQWIRVIAPSGEFRWISANHLSRRPPVEAQPLAVARPATTQHEQIWCARQQTHSSFVETSPPPNDFAHLMGPKNSTQYRDSFETAPSHRVAQTLAATGLPESEKVEIIAGSPAEVQLAQFQAQSQNLTSSQLLGQATPIPSQELSVETSVPRIQFPESATQQIIKSADVTTLELLLSQMVSQPPSLWELDPIKAEATDLLTKTNSPAERVHLRDLISRINRFDNVQRDYKSSNSGSITPLGNHTTENRILEQNSGFNSAPVEDQVARVVDNVRQRVQQDLRSAQPLARATNETKPLYDAVGKLKPVVSKREQAPPYALVNDKGDVVSFVTPTPDLNLQPYVGRHIGIHGNRGFMPEYRKAHVTAGRVSPINTKLRR